MDLSNFIIQFLMKSHKTYYAAILNNVIISSVSLDGRKSLHEDESVPGGGR